MRSAVLVRVLQIVVMQAVSPLASGAWAGVDAIDVAKRESSRVAPYREPLQSLREFNTVRDNALWVFRGPVVANQPPSPVLSTVLAAVELMFAVASSVILFSDSDTPSSHSGVGASGRMCSEARSGEDDRAD
jgi:hypothetical protein